MLKRGVSSERKEILSKEFTKRFIKNFILKGFVIGALFLLIYEFVTYFIKNSIIKELLSFIIIFFTINKIHIAAIKDTFYDSYIMGDNIRKVKNNIMIFFIVIALINIACNVIPAVKMYSIASGFLGTSYMKIIITQNIINTILYVIIIIFCRDEIDKQCFDHNKNKYIIKNVILVLIFIVIVIGGTIFLNWDTTNSLDNSDDGSSNKNNEYILENEIDLELVSENNTEDLTYNAQYTNGDFEFNVLSFETNIEQGEIYGTTKVCTEPKKLDIF